MFLMLLLPDLLEARRFYSDVLGATVIEGSKDRLRLALQEQVIEVFRCEAPAPLVKHGHAAAAVLVLHTSDIDRKMAAMKAKGVEFLHEAPATNELGRYAAFSAPGGLVHEIFQAF
jgi:catechol 2,3-dioxygenase-like lactoylglutathione lyase family enzyme